MARKPIPDPPDRRAALRIASERTGIPAYGAAWDLTRGVCRGRRCRSRWGLTRLTIDFRGAELERFAHVECAACGRVWRRTRIVPIRDRHGYQAVAVTAILPASSRRWFARGRWHAEGSDALILANASIGDLDDAARAHRALADRLAVVKARRKANHARLEALALEKSRALLARLAIRDAERDAEEAAALAREAA